MAITKLSLGSGHALDEAARLLGGRTLLAQKLNVSAAAIGNWKVRGVPIEQCVAIERATAGVVTRKDLRPDDYREIWPELASAEDSKPDQPQAHAAPAYPASKTVAHAPAIEGARGVSRHA